MWTIPLHTEFQRNLQVPTIGGKNYGMMRLFGIAEQLRQVHADTFIPPTHAIPTSYHEEFESKNGLENITEEAHAAKGANHDDAIRAFWRAENDVGLKPEILSFLMLYDGKPVIVRSSSTLEDEVWVGRERKTLAGSYRSLFYHNRAEVPIEQRVEDVFRMIKMILADNYNPGSYQARARYGISERSRMAIAMQPLVVQQLGPELAPLIGGVVFTENPRPWDPGLKEKDGVANIVLGFGTRAVGGKHAFRFAPGNPYIRIKFDDKTLMDASQERLHVIAPSYRPHLEHFLGRQEDSVEFPGLKEVELMYLLRSDTGVLNLLHGSFRDFDIDSRSLKPYFTGVRPIVTFHDWAVPVGAMLYNALGKATNLLGFTDIGDFEIAILGFNEKLGPPKDWHLNIVQARPISPSYQFLSPAEPPIGDIPLERCVLRTEDYPDNCNRSKITHAVYVTPDYFNLWVQDRFEVARTLNRLTGILEERHAVFALIGPGRWGNSDGTQGVPIHKNSLLRPAVLVEYPFASYTPDLGLGSHWYTRLLEAGIITVSMLKADLKDPSSRNYINHALLTGKENRIGEYLPGVQSNISDVVRVIDMKDISKRIGAIKGNRTKEEWRKGIILYGREPTRQYL